MSITRKPALTPEEAEKMAEQIRQGAVVRMEDPRLTSLQQWFFGVIGVAAVGGIGAILNSQARTNDNIAKINENIAVMIQRQDFNDRVNQQQDKHMEAIDFKNTRQDDRIGDLERFSTVGAPNHAR